MGFPAVIALVAHDTPCAWLMLAIGCCCHYEYLYNLCPRIYAGLYAGPRLAHRDEHHDGGGGGGGGASGCTLCGGGGGASASAAASHACACSEACPAGTPAVRHADSTHTPAVRHADSTQCSTHLTRRPQGATVTAPHAIQGAGMAQAPHAAATGAMAATPAAQGTHPPTLTTPHTHSITLHTCQHCQHAPHAPHPPHPAHLTPMKGRGVPLCQRPHEGRAGHGPVHVPPSYVATWCAHPPLC